MMEARWNNSEDCRAAADTIEGAVSCLLSFTHGEGDAYIYDLSDLDTLIKVIHITD